jgi:hypothetical protein
MFCVLTGVTKDGMKLVIMNALNEYDKEHIVDCK